MIVSVEKEIGGNILSIETGRLARQTDGAVTVRYGDTVVFANVVCNPLDEPKDFLPLIVEYREKNFAAGKIPGGFYKREGRPTTKEILTMRLIDRPIRPFFSDWYNHEVQITAFVISADQKNNPDIIAMLAASAALNVSKKIPFDTFLGTVRVGLSENQFILNPTYTQLKTSELNLVISGTEDAIVMVEGEAEEVQESIVTEAIYWGHQYIKGIIAIQKKLVEKLDLPAIEMPSEPAIKKDVDKLLEEKYTNEIKQGFEIASKIERSEFSSNLLAKVKEDIKQDEKFAELSEVIISKSYETLQKKIIREHIRQGKRIGNRKLDEIRPIECEVSFLPRAHGSALFTRGETQALATVTLGSTMDEQMVEGLVPEFTKRFMLHYNFPPFCVGEVRPPRGPSRREIGHGYLAEKALSPVLPDEERFPYTIRIVSEILESNGSSSMASICGGTLALMDAGVPIKKPVAGIAMGLIKDEDTVYILSDIMGIEDRYGDMDFKVAGTQRGITALQMDIKITDGIPKDLLIKTLDQAREGRIFILKKMMQALDHPKRDISPYAPRVLKLKINKEKISTIIGPSGKTVRKIQEETGSKISVEDDGIVTIYCVSKQGALAASKTIETLTQEVKIGRIYKGTVMSIKDFGAFVEILPNVEGLVHVSELAKSYVQNVGDVVKKGDKIDVKVVKIDEQNRIKLSKRAADQELAG